MAKIACPQCKKAYDVPEQALGRTATCKCGKKFRLGNKPAVATASATKSTAGASNAGPVAATSRGQSAKPRPAAPAPKPAATKPEPQKPSDSFWDEALSEPVKQAAPAPARVSHAPMDNPYLSPAGKAQAKPKKKKAKKVSWGVDWVKVGGGGGTFVLAGGGCVLLWMAGYINIWLILVTIGAFFTMITGLMGEEGIW